MGLAERRAVMEFETTQFPGLKKQIDDTAGYAVELDVRWDTLSKDPKYVTSWHRGWPKIYFEPVVAAFKEICADDMGKQALKEKLKKIVIQDTKGSYSSQWAELANGTLTLDYQFTNVDDIRARTDVLLKTLLKAL